MELLTVERRNDSKITGKKKQITQKKKEADNTDGISSTNSVSVSELLQIETSVFDGFVGF